jgi:hypothetical protein
VAHVLNVLKHTSERGAAFAALADMATSLAAVHCALGFETYLPGIHAHVREAISSRVKSRAPCPEALQVRRGEGGWGRWPLADAAAGRCCRRCCCRCWGQGQGCRAP